MILNNSKAKMRNYPKVSIIVLTFNGLEVLKISIPAVLKTNYPDFEVIVMENGSSDGSFSFLSKMYPNVSVIALKNNKGIDIPYNLGVSAAHGSLVAFLNNDMEVDPNWLLPLVKAMEFDERVACCDSKYLNYYERDKIDSSGGFIDNYGNTVNSGVGEIDKGQFNNTREVFHGSALFRKDLFMKVGGFDESYFVYYDETDICWRLHRFGYKILSVPESIIYHMGAYTISNKTSHKKAKLIVFHFYKNRLRTVIKNQFGISLVFSMFVCLSDYCGAGIRMLLMGDQDYIPILWKAWIWNLRNLRGTLQNRIRFKNKSTDFKKLFLHYSGVWKTKGGFV
jgi:GT2 family glycosyltransferase